MTPERETALLNMSTIGASIVRDRDRVNPLASIPTTGNTIVMSADDENLFRVDRDSAPGPVRPGESPNLQYDARYRFDASRYVRNSLDELIEAAKSSPDVNQPFQAFMSRLAKGEPMKFQKEGDIRCRVLAMVKDKIGPGYVALNECRQAVANAVAAIWKENPPAPIDILTAAIRRMPGVKDVTETKAMSDNDAPCSHDEPMTPERRRQVLNMSAIGHEVAAQEQ